MKLMKVVLGLAIVAAVPLIPMAAGNVHAASPVGKMHTSNMGWWKKARFGMFIHWGLYAVPAGVWHGKHVREPGEWIKTRAHIPNAQYNKLTEKFDPVDFNAKQWVKIAREAGIKYIVITSKHHDGFCMFNTKATNFNIVKATPWHQDPLALLSAACRTQGIKFCTYYSIMDWHSKDQLPAHPSATHPTYNPTHFAPGRGPAYLHYMERQIHELITQYHTHLLWFDGQWMRGWNKTYAHQLYSYIRSIDPTVIINSRIGFGYGDYATPEQHIPPRGLPGPWETCMTINNTWGYVSWDHHWKSSTMLIHHLIHCASGGGNFLLNVGPTAKGVIPKPEVNRLLAIGKWLRVNGQAIYGSHRTPFAKALPYGYATQKPGRLFLEVTRWPRSRTLVVPMHNKITRAYLLSNPYIALQTATGHDGQLIYLPARAPDPVATVVVLKLTGPVRSLQK
jgi:alpha-L-fucosidase